MRFNPKYIPALIQAKANKPLSGICSQLHALAKAEQVAYDEIAAYHAPSECAAACTRNLQRQADAAIRRSGFLCKEVLAGVIAARTSARWLHFSSVGRFLVD